MKLTVIDDEYDINTLANLVLNSSHNSILNKFFVYVV